MWFFWKIISIVLGEGEFIPTRVMILISYMKIKIFYPSNLLLPCIKKNIMKNLNIRITMMHENLRLPNHLGLADS